jgi:hypothetical protein
VGTSVETWRSRWEPPRRAGRRTGVSSGWPRSSRGRRRSVHACPAERSHSHTSCYRVRVSGSSGANHVVSRWLSACAMAPVASWAGRAVDLSVSPTSGPRPHGATMTVRAGRFPRPSPSALAMPTCAGTAAETACSTRGSRCTGRRLRRSRRAWWCRALPGSKAARTGSPSCPWAVTRSGSSASRRPWAVLVPRHKAAPGSTSGCRRRRRRSARRPRRAPIRSSRRSGRHPGEGVRAAGVGHRLDL